MGHDQPAAVEPQVAHQPVEKRLCLFAKRGRLPLHLLRRLCKAVGELDIAPVEPAHELHVMIAGNTKGGAAADHGVHQPQNVGCSWPSIDKVADEDRPATCWRGDATGAMFAIARPCNRIAQFGEQQFQLIRATMDVADDVERTGCMARVGP